MKSHDLLAKYDIIHTRLDRGEEWDDISLEYFKEKVSYEFAEGYLTQRILNALREERYIATGLIGDVRYTNGN